MIRFTCPHCRIGLRASDDKVGKTTRCPKCRSPIEVPAGQAQGSSAPAAAPSLPIPDSKELEPSAKPQPGKPRTGLLMLSLFVSGLVCGTVLFVVIFFKIKGTWLSSPVPPRQGHARPAAGRSSHVESLPPRRFIPTSSGEDKDTAEQPGSVAVSPPEMPPRKGREPKEEEYEAPPPKPPQPAEPPAMPSPATATADSALRESEMLVAPFVKKLGHPKVLDRLQAIEAVARLGPQGKAASRALCGCLLDPNLRVRFAAAEALDKINPTLHSLVIPILVDKNLDTRRECLRQIGRLGPAANAAVPVVVYFKQQYAGGGLAVEVLAAIAPDDPSVAAKLAGWLTSDPDPYVRLAVVKALPHMAGASNYVRAVVQSLRSDPVDAVRAAAANALGEMGRDAGSADNALRIAKADGSAQVREAAERALKKIALSGAP